jgi:hypothetical protein
MKYIVRVLLLFIFCGPAFGEDISVDKKIFASPGPNLFFVNPRLALNEKSRLTLAIWEKHPGNHPDHSTLSRRISSKGVPRGSSRTLVSGTNTYDPSILYNTVRNEFLLVYADEFQNPLHTIFVQKLDAQGRKRGGPVKVSTDTGSSFVNHSPLGIYDANSNQYVVVWSRNSTSTGPVAGEGFYAAVLDDNLNTVQGPVLFRPENSGDQLSDLAIHPAGKALVAFSNLVSVDPPILNYYVASFALDLTGTNIKKINKKTVKTLQTGITFAQLSSLMFVYFSDTGSVRKRKIDDSGAPTGKISPAFSGQVKNTRLSGPDFASSTLSGTPEGLLVAVEDSAQLTGQGKIWAQKMDAQGNPVGDPCEVDSAFITADDLQIIGLPSSNASQLQFSLIYVNGSQRTIPPQGEFSELIHLKLTVPAD